MKPAREVELLDLVHALLADLERVSVGRVHDRREVDGTGVPASCLSSVTAFLYRERDLDRCRAFIDRLDRLDTMAAQNPTNPRAYHLALRQVLQPWLRQHPELTVEECLYVLSWVRRLLPSQSEAEQSSRSSPRPPRPHRPSGPPPEPERRTPPEARMTAIKGKGLSQLAGLKTRLEKEEPGE